MEEEESQIHFEECIKQSKNDVEMEDQEEVQVEFLFSEMRITRVTEELYHNCYNRTTSQEILNESPVIIIKGMNHIQFADGVPSYFVNKNDKYTWV